jgi:hypothetical protein
MSSNQYGFTCYIKWEKRTYSIQVVFLGTDESDPYGSEDVMAEWESILPDDLAQLLDCQN